MAPKLDGREVFIFPGAHGKIVPFMPKGAALLGNCLRPLTEPGRHRSHCFQKTSGPRVPLFFFYEKARGFFNPPDPDIYSRARGDRKIGIK